MSNADEIMIDLSGNIEATTVSKEEIENHIELVKLPQYEANSTEKALVEYIEQLENKVREQEENIEDYERILDIFDKREYRKKYLEERRKEEKGLLYPDADEIYKKYYELKEDKQKLIDKLKEKIKYFEECDELIASSNDNYSDGTVTYRFIKEFTEILSIVKGENKRQ